MKRQLRIALAQINTTVGDIEGNVRLIEEYMGRAESLGADILAFPEMAVTGYPPEDLLHKTKFIQDNLDAIEHLSRSTRRLATVIGFVDRIDRELYNAAAVAFDGKVRGVYRKMYLPNYGVFDEKRYFRPGCDPSCFRFGDIVFGVSICEDIWYENGPVRLQAVEGAGLILNINASPYHAGKIRQREQIVSVQASGNRIPIAYVNLVGGQDELVFDGQSMVVSERGAILARAAAFREELLAFDVDVEQAADRLLESATQVSDDRLQGERARLEIRSPEPPGPEEEVYEALRLALRDYVTKNGFKKVVVGLSGGIDSAIVTAIAADALGPENVTGIFMPSRYSSGISREDALALGGNLGVQVLEISIEPEFGAYLSVLEPHFAGRGPDIAEENLQARIRGTILMAFSNKFGWLVLTTGNKSEMSTGYATLYGDMAGGFAVIKDVPKTLVYRLARYRNALSPVIPERIITREPTAELKPDQKDSDTLPPYEVLDEILRHYIEEDRELDEIVELGFGRPVVQRVLAMVDKSEYKRRQSPPGIKISVRAFGKDRRMPITNRYRRT